MSASSRQRQRCPSRATSPLAPAPDCPKASDRRARRERRETRNVSASSATLRGKRLLAREEGSISTPRHNYETFRRSDSVSSHMLRDLRFTFRLIAKERWFSAAAVVALALGIGVNAVGFTLINAAFLRGLPFDEADRLYMLTWQGRPGRRQVSHVELQEWREGSRTFAGFGAFRNGTMNISDARALPEQARGTWVTANSFEPAQAARPSRPRLRVRRRAPRARNRSSIISYTFWKNRYGADPNVLGTPVRMNGQPATIVGVMPEGMRFPDNTEVWAPAIPTAAQETRDARSLGVFGRLADAASRREAQTEMDGIAKRLAAAYPDAYKNLFGIRVETFTERYVGGAAKTMFLVMMGAVGFVLLIACANVANLLLSRSANRAREIAVRTALGATRWRVVRQLLVESLVLAFVGGALGLLLAYSGVRAFDAAVSDPGKPYWIDFRVDYVVFGYVAAICALTAVLFGLAPALHVSKTNNNEVLKEGGRGTTGNRRARWLSGTMVVTELALTVVLLAGAGLMIRSFMKLRDARRRVSHRPPDDDADAAAGGEIPDRRGAAGVLRPARASPRGDRRRRVGRGHDDRAAAPGRRAHVRDRRPARAPAAGQELEVGDGDDQPAILRGRRRRPAPRPRLSGFGRRARLRDRDHQRADGVAVLSRRGPDRPPDSIRGAGAGAEPAHASVAHDRRHQPDDSAQRDEAGRTESSRVCSVPAGTAGRRVAARPESAPAGVARGFAAPRRSRPSTRTSRSSRSRRSTRCSTRTAGRSASSASCSESSPSSRSCCRRSASMR